MTGTFSRCGWTQLRKNVFGRSFQKMIVAFWWPKKANLLIYNLPIFSSTEDTLLEQIVGKLAPINRSDMETHDWMLRIIILKARFFFTDRFCAQKIVLTFMNEVQNSQKSWEFQYLSKYRKHTIIYDWSAFKHVTRARPLESSDLINLIDSIQRNWETAILENSEWNWS